ncbi:MAG: hypothetical protein JNN28_16800, partial [Saprospiraceae bacterium]|nr:hypothetical protein [Saprospiraceae bacterium]
MLTAKSSLVIGFCMFLNIFLHAQNLQITYQKSDSLFVCGSDTLFIQIQNLLNVPVSDGILTASLPPGIIYVAGSVQGANQLNINNLSNPSFSVPQIAPQQTRQIFLLLTANCQAANLIDAGQLFNAQLSVNSSAGNAQVVTTSIPVETGALVIESVTPTLLSGERGDTLFRTICFRNTRLGKIGNIHFEDEHQTGYDIFIENADSFTADSTLVKAEFAANLFQTTGNGDEWLDPEETVCITERIIITDCGIPPVSRSSLLRSGWGCGSEWCRYDSLLTLVNILTSTKIPELSIQPLWSPPKDYCGEVGAEMGFLIHNTGHADAKNIVFNISLTEGFGEAGILPGSFKLVTSAGVQTILPSLTTPMYLAACDKTPFKTANFVLPVVPKQDSIRFLFDVITCAAVCEQVQPAFKVDYFFQKDCPINGSSSGNSLILPEVGYVVFAEHSASLGDCMEAGESYPFHYQARGKYLLEDGYWHLKMVLPKSVTIDPTCGLLLDNQTPALFESSIDNQGQQLVHLAWKTPLSGDTVDLDYCLKYTCDSNLICAPVIIDGEVVYTSACCFQSMTDVSYWGLTLQTPEQCGISDCNNRLLGVDNKCDPTGGGGGDFEVGAIPNVRIPGLKHWWMAYRQNPGWKDEQDDRKADVPLSVASSQWRKDRFLAGDTLRVEFCGTVDTLIQIDSIYYTVWNEVVASDLAINGNDIFVTETAQNGFTDTSKIILVETLVRIKYANGLEETCSWNGSYAKKGGVYIRLELPNTFPPQAIDEVCSMHHNYLFSLPDMMGAGCISKPYLEIGDSVFIYNDYKLNTNFKPASGNLPDPALVGFRTALNIGGGLVAWDNIASAKMQYSGWQLNRSPNTHTIKPCATSTEVKKFRYSLRIARENMFPFEVRPLGWISDYYQTCPQGLELQSARLEYLTLQDSLPWLSNISLPFAHTPEFLNIDFAPAFTDPLDEGFTLKTNLTFKPNCLYNLPDTSIQFVETSFQGCLNGDKMTRFDSIINPIGFFANTPRITL